MMKENEQALRVVTCLDATRETPSAIAIGDRRGRASRGTGARYALRVWSGERSDCSVWS